jgi:hypothetical protein
MTRVLFWNINNFGTNGFFPGANDRQRSVGNDGEYDEPAAPADAEDRLEVLLGVIETIEPDIVSVVEVQPGAIGIAAGKVLADVAAVDLLERIRDEVEFAGADEFCLVPPLVSGVGGKAEGVAVYYRKDRLQFLGPYRWNGEQAEPAADVAVPAAYPQEWDFGLPHRKVADGWTNEKQWEDRLAGQYAFVQLAEAPALQFPTAGMRTPWLTCFRDIAGGRLVKLLSYHAPPNTEDASLGIRRLAQIAEMSGAIAANEVRCIVGDFNVSTLVAFDRAFAFGPLTGVGGYTLQFNPAAIAAERRPQGYFTTFLQRAATATPWISTHQGAVVYGYPGFGYMERAIDSALTRHGAGAGAVANQTICNPVTESPYDDDPAPPAGVVIGSLDVLGYMDGEPHVLHYAPWDDELGVDESEEDPPDKYEADDVATEFREWENFTHIRSCSDHLPIALDI